MKKQVVIVGGGCGGLTAARALADQPVEVTLVDRSNHHLFQPLLYALGRYARHRDPDASAASAGDGPRAAG